MSWLNNNQNPISRWLAMREMEKKGLLGTRKRRTASPLSQVTETSRVMRIFMLVLLWVVCSMLLIWSSRDKVDYTWQDADRAPHSVFARFDYEYEAPEETNQIRLETLLREPLILQVDRTALNDIEQRFKNFFYQLAADEYKAPPETAASPGYQAALALCRKLIPETDSFQNFAGRLSVLLQNGIIASSQIHLLDGKSPEFFDEVKKTFATVHPEALHTQIPDNIESPGVVLHDIYGRRRNRMLGTLKTPEIAAQELATYVLHAVPPQEGEKAQVQSALADIFTQLLGEGGDLYWDEEATLARRKAAMASAKPILKRVDRDSLIVAGNQKLTVEDRASLAQYQQIYNDQTISLQINRELFGELAFCLSLVIFATLYLLHMHPDVIRSNRQLFLLCSIIIISLFINFFYIRFFDWASAEYGISPRLIFSVVPVLLASVLLAVTMGLRVSIGGGFFVAVVTAQMLHMPFQQAVLALLICSVTGLAVRRSTNYRSLFLRTMGLLLLYWLLDGDAIKILVSHPGEIYRTLLVAGISTISSAMLVLPLVFLFELAFNVSTNMSLLVLCDYNHPLLKELHLRAPGTSMHSQNVAILAENAAKVIDANPLRARAAALYHDIGKIVNPEYFTENNIDSANQHTSLSPRMSSIIILNHVKDGLDIALKYKLCRVIRDAIQQHHGTDLLYFYHKAQTGQNESTPVEKDYRYPGPLPHDKEVAIVSLADACEAYCRSLEKPTPSKIEAAVDEIFRNRMRGRQLDDAQLTVAELAKIRENFIWTLTTMYHSRIAYKKSENNDESDLFMEKPASLPAQPQRTDSRNEARN